MQVQWKKILVKTSVWLTAEIILNLIGLDDLADYSEFIYEQDFAGVSHLYQPTVVM
ncbi:hypothetical protein [Lyngbya aestuarii]|uniref:hypothetical protein n=1 Tax=Lyngbya aestuarii TaxID=118322 RepID=UPI00403DDE59